MTAQVEVSQSNSPRMPKKGKTDLAKEKKDQSVIRFDEASVLTCAISSALLSLSRYCFDTDVFLF